MNRKYRVVKDHDEYQVQYRSIFGNWIDCTNDFYSFRYLTLEEAKEWILWRTGNKILEVVYEHE